MVFIFKYSSSHWWVLEQIVEWRYHHRISKLRCLISIPFIFTSTNIFRRQRIQLRWHRHFPIGYCYWSIKIVDTRSNCCTTSLIKQQTLIMRVLIPVTCCLISFLSHSKMCWSIARNVYWWVSFLKLFWIWCEHLWTRHFESLRCLV